MQVLSQDMFSVRLFSVSRAFAGESLLDNQARKYRRFSMDQVPCLMLYTNSSETRDKKETLTKSTHHGSLLELIT